MLKVLLENPVIATCKSEDHIQDCINSSCKIVFLLCGDICNIQDIIQDLHDAGKIVFVHIDLIEGLTPSEIAVRFIKQHCPVDGIISTKTHVVKAAKSMGLQSILRIFVVDSFSYFNIEKQVQQCKPDAIEIMPGVLSYAIEYLSKELTVPIIAGGMVCEEYLVLNALNSGAFSISTSNQKMWKIASRLKYDDKAMKMIIQ